MFGQLGVKILSLSNSEHCGQFPFVFCLLCQYILINSRADSQIDQ